MKRRSWGTWITEQLRVDWSSESTRRHQMAHAFWSYFVSGLLKLPWVSWSRPWLTRTWIHLYLEWCLCPVFWKMIWACDVLYLSVNFALSSVSSHWNSFCETVYFRTNLFPFFCSERSSLMLVLACLHFPWSSCQFWSQYLPILPILIVLLMTEKWGKEVDNSW